MICYACYYIFLIYVSCFVLVIKNESLNIVLCYLFVTSICIVNLKSEKRKQNPKTMISEALARIKSISSDMIKLLNDSLCNKKKKATKVTIPCDDATTYFLNGGYFSRSWTELRLF